MAKVKAADLVRPPRPTAELDLKYGRGTHKTRKVSELSDEELVFALEGASNSGSTNSKDDLKILQAELEWRRFPDFKKRVQEKEDKAAAGIPLSQDLPVVPKTNAKEKLTSTPAGNGVEAKKGTTVTKESVQKAADAEDEANAPASTKDKK